MHATKATVAKTLDCSIIRLTADDVPTAFYARCDAPGCTYVGDFRHVQGWATRDAHRHEAA